MEGSMLCSAVLPPESCSQRVVKHCVCIGVASGVTIPPDGSSLGDIARRSGPGTPNWPTTFGVIGRFHEVGSEVDRKPMPSSSSHSLGALISKKVFRTTTLLLLVPTAAIRGASVHRLSKGNANSSMSCALVASKQLLSICWKTCRSGLPADAAASAACSSSDIFCLVTAGVFADRVKMPVRTEETISISNEQDDSSTLLRTERM
mmetsp:Transcript_306/g.1046  ORF Transcript_306/g.1046 Transcript_306/m.1046 type:complete len:205 (+) Transcript_306:1507-2121(+)